MPFLVKRMHKQHQKNDEKWNTLHAKVKMTFWGMLQTRNIAPKLVTRTSERKKFR